ncbi:hypothetical protein [Hoeflea sp.]|uniref:hypothetical protein n=1 Tax=Hoeflea sp. TaxID=1940281 RepID=UPI0025C032A8|nr:hypothetical protein [Hoeflea sp.]
MTAKVWYGFLHPAETRIPKPPTTAAHVSLSSIFNCQKTDLNCLKSLASQQLALGHSENQFLGLLNQLEGELVGASGAPPSLCERFIGATLTKSQQPFFRKCSRPDLSSTSCISPSEAQVLGIGLRGRSWHGTNPSNLVESDCFYPAELDPDPQWIDWASDFKPSHPAALSRLELAHQPGEPEHDPGDKDDHHGQHQFQKQERYDAGKLSTPACRPRFPGHIDINADGGGVIVSMPATSTTTTPNQTGSKPLATTIGTKAGIVSRIMTSELMSHPGTLLFQRGRFADLRSTKSTLPLDQTSCLRKSTPKGIQIPTLSRK